MAEECHGGVNELLDSLETTREVPDESQGVSRECQRCVKRSGLCSYLCNTIEIFMAPSTFSWHPRNHKAPLRFQAPSDFVAPCKLNNLVNFGTDQGTFALWWARYRPVKVRVGEVQRQIHSRTLRGSRRIFICGKTLKKFSNRKVVCQADTSRLFDSLSASPAAPFLAAVT